MSQLRHGDPYSADFQYTIHPQQSMEPLTGADLAVDVNITIDRQLVYRKLFLVQLKLAKITNQGLHVPELHYKSGEKFFGKDIHQAQKMLLFSPSSVYWICVPSSSIEDQAFLQKYARSCNLAQRSNRIENNTLSLAQNQWDSHWPLGMLNQPSLFFEILDELPSFHYYYRRILKELGRSPKNLIEDRLERHKAEQKANLLRSLQYDARQEAWRTGNLGSRYSVLVVHATSVLALAIKGQTDLESIIDLSTSLPDFILGGVISDGFGDDNPSVLQSMTQRKSDIYIRTKIDAFARERVDIDGTIPARAIMKLKLDLRTDSSPRG